MNNFLTLSLIIQINLARITNNDLECEVFKSKIGVAKVVEKNSPPLQVGGDVGFQPGSSNLEIQLHYNDDQYFFDPRFKGLTKEDGIDNELTCLDLKLLKFPDSQFNESTQQEITDLKPFASSDQTTRCRYLTYTIPGDQLKTRLVVTESQDFFYFRGYYAIAYYIETQAKFTYQFQFTVTINKATSSAIDTSFLGITNKEAIICEEEECEVTPSSSVEFCTNSTCVDTTTSPIIYLNEDFWLIQKITTPGLALYYLSDTQIYYIGESLRKPAIIDAANCTVPGQAIYRIKASFAWTKLSILVTKYTLNSTPKRRLLADHEKTQTSQGESVQTCILVRNSTECPTCAEMIKNNPDGIAPKVCDCSAKMLLLIGLALFSFLF